MSTAHNEAAATEPAPTEPAAAAAPQRQARTVGVAIAIPEPFGSQLQEHRASFGDPLARLIPAHITLLSPTEVSIADAGERRVSGAFEPSPDVGTHLAAVASSAVPFEIHLRGTATFRPVSPVVFVQLVEGIGQCEVLEQQVRSGPLTHELSFPYHPHVTVAHHLPDDRLNEAFEALAGFECRFDVSALHLYEHGADGVWRPERSYPFGVRG